MAAQVQANIKCSQSAYLQIWNRYLHWKVGMFLCIQGPPIWMLAANLNPVQFMETSETMLRHYCVCHCHMSAILLLLLKYFSRYTKIFSWSSVQTIPAVLRHLPCQIHNILCQLQWQSENLQEWNNYILSSELGKNSLLLEKKYYYSHGCINWLF